MSDEKTAVDQQNQAEFPEDAQEQVEQPADAVNLGEEAERWKKEAEETNDRLLRAMADMENMRRRFRKEQEDMQKYAALPVVEALLPAIDNFERAMSVDKENLTVDSLLQGINMVYRQMVQVFEKEGLQAIESVGKPFDPHIHQAVMQVEDSAYEPGTVVEELQKGYQFKDRTVRPAMVKVNG
ncbi:UNVERIFIED_CONTAM: molecular chaperone GrpE [Brevibacillus sp. OAP136]|uniref:nucleotide exchange factor GrpE n=1 Tax=Brevibacillus fluminis TaxID=511487 RepID=UPI001FE69B25|nr:nucleotide exchange factor GrpE [Brevibacillus fluminis]